MALTLPPNWALPVTIEAYKQRQQIVSVLRTLFNLIVAKKRRIVVTGMSGAGKTMLMNALSGATEKPGFKPPERSIAAEHHRVDTTDPRRRIALTIVPGQPGYHRRGTMEQLLTAKKPIDGIVHVVCNGFAEFHSSPTNTLEKQVFDSAEQLQTHHFAQELEDLRGTLDLAIRSWEKHRHPFWTVVAVAKVDLYHDNLAQAAQRYAPGGQSPFIDVIRDAQMTIGSINFRWTAQPVCSWLQVLDYGGGKLTPQIGIDERNHYMTAFASALEHHCA